MHAPIIWDFDQITAITARPIDEKVLTITGGRFITIANKDASKYNYYSRNIAIRRSNVIVDGLEHRVTGEADHGAPLHGFHQPERLRLCHHKKHRADRAPCVYHYRCCRKACANGHVRAGCKQIA